MTEEEQDLWFVLENVNSWIRFADAKAGATLAVSAAVASLSAIDAAKTPQGPVVLALSVASLVAGIGTLLFGLLALAPILQPDEERDTTLFFGHIAKFRSTEAYLEAVQAARRGGELDVEVAHQIRTNARIAAYKFKKIERATQFVAAQLGLAAVVLASMLLGEF